ncbi:MAG: recombinase family protein [Gemmatimonas sp.]
MRKYFAYIRVSTAKQGEHGSSLTEQKSAIEAFAKRQDLAIISWFEERETAAKGGRAVFTKLMQELERNRAHGVIIHKIDRSARNLRDWARLGELIDRGVDVQFAHDSVDLKSRGGRLSADIQAVVAADFIRNLRDEVKKGFYGRLKQGFYPLPAPVGYLDRGPAKAKDIDPMRGPLVRQAFELYGTGSIGLKPLRVEMAKRGLTAPLSGNPLSLTGISTMLNNPFYTGLIRIRRTNETFEGSHTPLVSQSLFNHVQAVLRGKTVARVFKHGHQFRRLIRCASCGKSLIGETQKKKYTYYRCHNCAGVIVREEVLDAAVLSALQYLSWESDDERIAVDEIVRSLAQTGARGAKEMQASLHMQIAQCDERLGRLTDALVDGVLEKELFESRKRVVLERKRTLQEQLSHAAKSAPLSARALADLELGNTAQSGYRLGIPSERRDIVKAVTSNFVVQEKNPYVELRSPFREIAEVRKSSGGGPHRVTVRTRAEKLVHAVIEALSNAGGTGGVLGQSGQSNLSGNLLF